MPLGGLRKTKACPYRSSSRRIGSVSTRPGDPSLRKFAIRDGSLLAVFFSARIWQRIEGAHGP